MENTDLISANDFCTHNHISYTFISRLEEAGLVEVITVQEHTFLHADQLRDIEKLMCFHTELEVNIEGLEVIAHLLQQMKDMQQQMKRLQGKLNLYE